MCCQCTHACADAIAGGCFALGMLLRALGSARHSSVTALRRVCVGSACLRLRQRVALKAQLQLVVPECRRHPLHTNKRTLTLPFGVRKCVPGTASCAHSRPYTHGWSVFGLTRQVQPSPIVRVRPSAACESERVRPSTCRSSSTLRSCPSHFAIATFTTCRAINSSAIGFDRCSSVEWLRP